jgi:hypothetical protein
MGQTDVITARTPRIEQGGAVYCALSRADCRQGRFPGGCAGVLAPRDALRPRKEEEEEVQGGISTLLSIPRPGA